MKSEKSWKRFYLFMMIFFYAIYVPISLLEWLGGDSGIPVAAVVVGVGLPFIRKNHLIQIKEKRNEEA
ncbi:hypothetical protein [Bacillus sp. FJAT-27245]|uniref:hypothetical protein n=1 Tax=Bacillus sp. FJAT-27245 TaxID=1684144 RepID=UPI0006A79DFB|nr:hypothetical protein [Bacillus sp. FJAT-27245]